MDDHELKQQFITFSSAGSETDTPAAKCYSRTESEAKNLHQHLLIHPVYPITRFTSFE